MSKKYVTIILIFFATGLSAQSFQWNAEMPQVDKDGFYQILLGPEIISHVRKDLWDIRLYGNGEEIPYIIRQEKPVAESGKYVILKPPTIIEKDSTDRSTYLWIKYDAPQIVDKIRFSVDHPSFYQRDASICMIRYDKRNRQQLVPILNFTLRSNQENEVMTDFKAEEFCVVINNKDNPPLRINNLEGFQLVRYLTAFLKAGESYRFEYGSPEIRKPEYDLMFYHDSIPVHIPVIQVMGLTEILPGLSVEKKNIFNPAFWIWWVILVIIGVLGYMSWRMVGDMKGERKPD
jgi:hypothetical protein